MKTTTQGQLERMRTGIRGLDELIEGGLIRGDMHLLVGGPGTGKTIFAANFVYNGVKSGERAIYASFEESADYFKRNMKLLGLEFVPMEKEGKVKIVDLDALKGTELETNVAMLAQAAEEAEATILVIDSLTALLLACETRFETRTFVKSVYNSLKGKGITTLMTASTPDTGAVGVEGFLSDSVLVLENWVDLDQYKTRFVVMKMRGTDHSRKYHSVVFSPQLAISRY